jgi:hypothetical protein
MCPNRPYLFSKYPILLGLSITLFFIITSPSVIFAESVLEVHVSNVTQGEVAPKIPVTVQIFEGDSEIQRFETTTDVEGKAIFSVTVPKIGSFNVMASAVYKEVRYFSEIQFISYNKYPLLDLEIYDPTRNKEYISISSESAIIFQQVQKDSLLHVVQITTFENSSRQAFIGSDTEVQSVLHIPLPPMAFDVQNISNPGSLEFSSTTNQLYSTVPALPGKNEIVVSYKCLYTSDTYIWAKTFFYPHKNIMVALPSRFTINANDGWKSTSVENLNAESYTKYSLTGKPEDSQLFIADLPLSEGSQSKLLQESIRTVTVWSVVIITLLFILHFIIRNRSR